MLVAT